MSKTYIVRLDVAMQNPVQVKIIKSVDNLRPKNVVYKILVYKLYITPRKKIYFSRYGTVNLTTLLPVMDQI
jgi:hypothetical protein